VKISIIHACIYILSDFRLLDLYVKVFTFGSTCIDIGDAPPIRKKFGLAIGLHGQIVRKPLLFLHTTPWHGRARRAMTTASMATKLLAITIETSLLF